MQYSVISTRSTCLYGSQCFFACKTATFGEELELSMGPRPLLSFSACKTAWIASEILVSMGPCPHLWFLDAKQRLFYQNYKSLFVPVLTSVLCMQISVISTRITSLYGFQPSSEVLRIQNSVLKTKIACVYGSQTSVVIFFMQNSVNSIRITSLYVSQPSSVVFGCKTATFWPELQVSMGPRPH